jgi:hypothetical protein
MTFKPGQTGNPKGRPRGSRDKITQAFLNDLERHWRQHGKSALDAALEKAPESYVKVVASLLPKDVNLNANVGETFLEILKAIDEKRISASGPVVASGVDGERDESAPVRH